MNRIALLFARRYLFSSKSHSVINIISGVSAFAVAIPVAAMVILLSVFNGFETMIRGMYRQFDPDVLITPARGKLFTIDSLPAAQLHAAGAATVSYTLEENALFEYRGRQIIGMMKGVDSVYADVVPLDSLIVTGDYRLRLGDFEEAVVGQGIAYTLGIRTAFNDPLLIYVPRRGSISPLLPQSIYRQERLYPSGIFALDAESDGQYVFVSLELAQHLLDAEGRAAAAAVKVREGVSVDAVQKRLAQELGDRWRVLTRYQQNESFYRIMFYEKWGIYFIILLVLVIASFSLIGSLAMLIIEKRKDTRTLATLGAPFTLIRRIFTAEGMLIYSLGACGGLLLGVVLALAQQHFGWIGLGGETFLIDAYPVELRLADLLWVTVTFLAVAWVISTFTVRVMIKPGVLYSTEENQV